MKKYYVLLLFFLGLFAQCVKAQSNQYLHFDGVDDFTELANGSQFINNSNTISMAGWFYTDELIYGQGMMSLRGGGSGNGEMYIIQLSDGVMECRLKTGSTLYEVVAPAGTVQAGVWQHIAWVFNQNVVQLYIDGVLIGSNPAAGTFQAQDRPFTIGKSFFSDLNFHFKGRADEVSLWNKALTVTEIQNMMNNELTGNEAGLQVYYKFNQGNPGGNNTGILQVFDLNGASSKNSYLRNFALTGETSNFNGELESDFQYISIERIPNKVISSAPFEVVATTNSGLPVTFEIVSGPATVEGNVITLTGQAGEVMVKASQAGNQNYQPATDVLASFLVLDPEQETVQTGILHPLAGNVYAPNLIPLQVAVSALVENPDVISIDNVTAFIDGQEVALVDFGNGYYTGWWTPTSYGTHRLVVNATNDFGAESTTELNFNLQQSASTQTINAINQAWVNSSIATVIQNSDLPSHIGAFNHIKGILEIDCPSGGCDPWDRISSIEVLGKNGEWYEIIRYMTPYGVACRSEIDLTDFSSLLLGKTFFRVNLGTQGNGFLYTLKLEYTAGTDTHPYKTIEKLWYDTYQFGDLANLQPAPELFPQIPEGVQKAKLKLVSPGHGWDVNNTNNAAEFSRNIHHIWVNNQQTFEQDNWNICNPNPDNCSPQYGTWYNNRAGWCPGSIAQYFDYDMTPYINSDNLSLKYIFDQGYVDYCHPNNPDCVNDPQSCPDCNDGFNPHLMVVSYLISSGNQVMALNIDKTKETINTHIYPNPSNGRFTIDINNVNEIDKIVISDILGRTIKTFPVDKGTSYFTVDVTGQPSGVYLVSFISKKQILQSKRIIIE